MITHVIAVRLSDVEWNAWQHLCQSNHCSTQDMLHAVVTDALIDEGYDGLRCREPEGRPSAGEGVEVREPATDGSDKGNNVCTTRQEMDVRPVVPVPCVQHELFGPRPEDELHGRTEGSSNLGVNGYNVSMP